MYNYQSKKNDKIYIISGKYKGRKISFRNIVNLRPTTSRIRKTLFEWLSRDIINARCLDCFAGSGALGIEAISRYAKFTTFLEIEKKNFFTLQQNIKKLNISNLELIRTDALYWLKKRGKPYDIIFIDPPYKQGLVDKTLLLLEENNWVKKNSLIYIEKEKNTNIIVPKHYNLYKKKTTKKIEFCVCIFSI